MSAARVGIPVLAAVALLTACDFERASVTSPVGEPSYDFRLTVDGRGVPRGTAVVSSGGDSIQVTLRGLEALSSGVYQVWLGNVDDTASPDTTIGFVPAAGVRVVVRTDTTFTPEGDPVPSPVTIDSTAGVSSFTAGGPNVTITLTIDSASLGVLPTTYDVLLVSIESATGAASPSSTQPLWARSTGTSGTKTLRFGNFHPDPALQYTFTATGRGTAGIRGNVLIVDDSALARPPEGYYYATWVVQRNEDGDPVDTLQLGPQTAPFPDRSVSLREADVTVVHPVVLESPPSILAAANRLQHGSGSDPFLGFEDLWVTLENKVGVEEAAAPTIVLSGTVPTIVSDGS